MIGGRDRFAECKKSMQNLEGQFWKGIDVHQNKSFHARHLGANQRVRPFEINEFIYQIYSQDKESIS
jgi:hypothetical protein